MHCPHHQFEEVYENAKKNGGFWQCSECSTKLDLNEIKHELEEEGNAVIDF